MKNIKIENAYTAIINDLIKKENDNVELINELHKTQHSMRKQLSIEIDKYLSDPDVSPLKESKFTLKLGKNGYYLVDDNRDGFKLLRQLLEDDYHCSTKIMKDRFFVIFNDGEMHVTALGKNKIEDLIKEFNLELLHDYNQELVEIENQIAALKDREKELVKIIKSINK